MEYVRKALILLVWTAFILTASATIRAQIFTSRCSPSLGRVVPAVWCTTLLFIPSLSTDILSPPDKPGWALPDGCQSPGGAGYPTGTPCPDHGRTRETWATRQTQGQLVIPCQNTKLVNNAIYDKQDILEYYVYVQIPLLYWSESQVHSIMFDPRSITCTC